MYEIIEVNMNARRTVIATAASFEDAKKLIADKAAFMEDDADFPDCADAFLKDGRVVAIQPVGFSLAA